METLLQYAGEHRSCLNYRMPQDAAIKLLHYPEGMRQIVDTDESLIIFVLEGEVKVSADGHNDVLHRAGYISLQPRNSSSYIQVQQPCTFISFHSPHDITLCDRFSVQSLPRYIPEGFHYQFTLLPIRQRLAEYATGLRHCLEDGLGCVHFLEMKMQELFILLRAYYNREELANKQAEQIASALAFDKNTSKQFIDTYCRYLKETWEARSEKGTRKGPARTDEEIEQAIQARFERSQKLLDLRKKYYEEYRKFLTPTQIQRVYDQERKIMNHLQNRWKGTHANHSASRPGQMAQPDELKYKLLFDQINNNDLN